MLIERALSDFASSGGHVAWPLRVTIRASAAPLAGGGTSAPARLRRRGEADDGDDVGTPHHETQGLKAVAGTGLRAG